MKIVFSGRSSDYITPSFGYGCLLNCSYCYMKRHLEKGVNIATNTEQILTEINNHSYFATTEKPNQTDSKYITYDISCNEDFALHAKYHEWEKIFEFFKTHPIAKATFATKIVPKIFLKYNPNKKVRIRFSLMPQKIADKVEPNTSKIIDRIKAINNFKKAGYDVHVNFSPVILYNGWENDYKDLFKLLDNNVKKEYKKDVLAEVIFLTHNINKHKYNVVNNIPGEELLWQPEIQETKVSSYDSVNLRYNYILKSKMVEKFKIIHNNIKNWNKIRYIF